MYISINNVLITPNIGLMFWTLLFFVLLLVVLRRFAWKPIMDGLKSREQSITTALDEAKKARLEMANLKTANEAMMQEARINGEKIIREAREIKDKIVSEAQNKAQAEGKRILAQANEQINAQKNAAMAELRDEVAKLAVEGAQRILRRELSQGNAQEMLAESSLDQIRQN